MIALFLIILLPLLEIAGFIMIGGRIGVGLSLLWVIAATIYGFHLLGAQGRGTWQKARKSVNDDVFPFEEMFDGLCILFASLLFIFPGFISDFLAVPLVITPLRHWIFLFLKAQHNSVFERMGKNTQGFASLYEKQEHSSSAGRTTTIIEGEFKTIDEDKKRLDS